MNIVENKIYRIKERDIIKVQVRPDYVQPFYRSTGKNSGKKEVWLPFDGVLSIIYKEGEFEIPVWFDKSSYTVRNEDGTKSELNRYGTVELMELSAHLGTMKIAQGEEALPSVVNKFLGYNNRVEDLK